MIKLYDVIETSLIYMYIHIYSSCINKNWFDLSIEILPVSKLSRSNVKRYNYDETV